MNGDLKQTFILKCLQQYFEETIEAIRIAAKRAKVGVTDDAVKSLSYEALQSGNEGGTGQLKFNEYLRFVDMGVGRSHPLGGMTTMKVTLQAQQKTGAVQIKNKTRKPKKIYSKIAYGKLNYLTNRLLYGYTEETIALLKQELEKTNTNGTEPD